MKKITCVILAGALLGEAAGMAYEITRQGIDVRLPRARLRVELITPVIYHVTLTPWSRFSDRPSLAVIKTAEETPFGVEERGSLIVVKTTRGEVTIDRMMGELVFHDAKGREYLRASGADEQSFKPAAPGSDNALELRQVFRFPAREGLFGLGQFEDGVLNLRGHSLLLAQANRVAINPFLVSSRGSGLLWDNYSVTRFDDDGEATRFVSEAGDEIDYYVVAGAAIDEAIAGYRTLTGAAPLFPLWAYGYFQSRERYKSADEVVEVVQEYRKRGIPLDVIVQDWSYWGGAEHFSGMVWDPQNYPDPAAMAQKIHDLHARLMVSIWPAFGPASEIYAEMAAQKLLYPEPHWSGSRVYDAYSAKAREIYWRYIKSALYDQGVDAYWMDGTEPEFRCSDDRYITSASIKSSGRCALGSLIRYANPYSLVTTQGVYEGQRRATDEKRVFILTRSAFAGQQRHAAVTWSGDTFAGWQVFKNQITAGLTFSMSGIPYWTADIGGFLSDALFPEGAADPAFRELYVRWFQFGAFCPIFRSHGTNTPREMWQFGEPGSWAYEALVQTDRLRYRLLPWLYSQAWRVTHEGYTLMRGLPMDFPNDVVARDLGTQYMFGPGLMVCPVTTPMHHPPAEQAEAIPSRCLFGPEGSAPGLDLALYRDMAFAEPVLRRKLDQSSIGWFGCIPVDLDAGYSARLSGQLLCLADGTHYLTLTSDGSVRMWFRDTLIVDAWDNRQVNTFRVSIALQEGKKYPFRIEHQQFLPRQANLRLAWMPPQPPATPEQLEVYLPGEESWFDFWTGTRMKKNGWQAAPAPLERIPLFVPAGTILPLGAVVQYAGERAPDSLEVRIYAGKDALFTLYEDENDGYGYESGRYATVTMRWEEASKSLLLCERAGNFPGMLARRTFRIVLVRPGHGDGIEPAAAPDRIVAYEGQALKIEL